ncbi:hypothetical protein C8R45DRAFT_538256 [Mycena sanguinolenta]|nr:hypothetical protein C8R45DRAFT_538256 [Mycena sanguinolenta]
MVECNAAGCAQEGQSQCTRCKQRFYCGVECQQKDWPAHKKECKRPGANANAGSSSSQTRSQPTLSYPYGQILMPDGSIVPMSYNAKFWAPMFGYTSANPESVYKDLVNAYRVLRLGAHLNASLVSSALQEIDFTEWMERVVRAQMLPEWWDAEVNGAGLERYTSQDAWGRLDRTVTRAELESDPPTLKRMNSFGMMIENALRLNSGGHI